MNISKGKKKIPYKVVIYGAEGIGKTTFASKFPAPVFIDTEDSTARMDGVDRFDGIKTLDEVNLAIETLRTEDHSYQTLVIDTFDKLELMINDKVCEEQKVTGIEAIGYGKGYTYVAEKVNKLLGALDALRMAKGMNIVIVCHAQMRKFEQPDEMGAYDRWELKLSKKAAPMVKEWADMVLFANYKTFVIKDGSSNKAQGGKRVMYTTHNPCWDAKNRDGLPDQCEFDFAPIAHLFGKTEQPKTEAPKKENPKKKEEPELVPWSPEMNDTEKKLFELMKRAKVTEDQVIVTFHEKGKFDGIMTIHEINDWEFIERSVINNWDKFLKAVEKYGKAVPFIH